MPSSSDPYNRPVDDPESKLDFKENISDELSKKGIPSSEERLWQDFQRGSESALAEIFILFADKLYNYGRQFTPDQELVNDVIQDVFFTLIKSRDKIGTATSVKFYLYSSFRRRLVRLLKKNKKIVLTEDFMDDTFFQIGMNPHYFQDDVELTVEQRTILDEAFNKLPVRQKEILLLYFFEDLSYKEIAEIMEFSQVKSARKLLYRSLDSLYGHLSPHKDILRILLFMF